MLCNGVLVHWDGSWYADLVISQDACTNLQNYMTTTLNPYIINLTLAAKICSQVFCQERGYCVRKNWDSFDYLHLNPMNFAIKITDDGKFIVQGKPTVEDLKQFSEKFNCSCYPNVSCEKKVVLTDTQAIHVCATKDVCVETILNSKNEIVHSSTSVLLCFLLFLIFFWKWMLWHTNKNLKVLEKNFQGVVKEIMCPWLRVVHSSDGQMTTLQ